MYARQLAEHYNGTATYSGPPRGGSRGGREVTSQRPRKEMGQRPTEPYDERERSFLDGVYLHHRLRWDILMVW